MAFCFSWIEQLYSVNYAWYNFYGCIVIVIIGSIVSFATSKLLSVYVFVHQGYYRSLNDISNRCLLKGKCIIPSIGYIMT